MRPWTVELLVGLGCAGMLALSPIAARGFDDPLIASTFLGGDEEDRGTGVAFDFDGHVFVTGSSALDTLRQSIHFGGSQVQEAWDLSLTHHIVGEGPVVIAGWTETGRPRDWSYPVVPAGVTRVSRITPADGPLA